MKITLELAKRIINAAETCDYYEFDFDQGLIGANQPYRCEENIEELGDDYFYMNEKLCAETYGLETDWTAHCQMIIGPSGGDPERTIVYLRENTISEVERYESMINVHRCLTCNNILPDDHQNHVKCAYCGELN